ncbi:hypothetical protein SDC9_153265 [bioreactor metagenome]|uniref:Uncharacterized protein n=1 Tax=bioreactor metagenome TaxID=1076179 RepID=A0A645EVF8_9ZZZZ
MVFFELEAVGTDIILEIMALSRGFPDIEPKRRFAARPEEVMEQPQALGRVQFLGVGTHVGKVRGHIGYDAGEVGAGLADVLLMDGNGHIPLLQDAVGRACDLAHQHLVVFLAEMIQTVVFLWQQDGFLKLFFVEPPVGYGDLGGGAHIQGVQKLRVIQEHLLLVSLGRDGVVDVREPDAFGEFVAHLKNPIRPDTADGNGLLHGLGNAHALPVLAEHIGQRFNHGAIPP